MLLLDSDLCLRRLSSKLPPVVVAVASTLFGLFDEEDDDEEDVDEADEFDEEKAVDEEPPL